MGSDDTDINFAVSFNEIRNFLNNLPLIEKKNLDPNCSLRTIPKQEITGDWNHPVSLHLQLQQRSGMEHLPCKHRVEKYSSLYMH